MKQYEPEIICPKCGHTDIGTAFCTRIFPNDYGQHDGVQAGQEHFDRWCRRCRFKWVEAVSHDAR